MLINLNFGYVMSGFYADYEKKTMQKREGAAETKPFST
jgi:hypothetical protein